jgi:hypothetical protein
MLVEVEPFRDAERGRVVRGCAGRLRWVEASAASDTLRVTEEFRELNDRTGR